MSEFQLGEGGLEVFDDFRGDVVGIGSCCVLCRFSFSAFPFFNFQNALSSRLSSLS
jgi:hypothetical protein